MPPWMRAAVPPIDKGGPGEGEAGDDPRAQLALWKKRLQRAGEVLENYSNGTRYPHESRPIAEHPDQIYPNQPIVEDKKLYRPGDEVKGKIRLRTSQERIFVTGNESVLFTISAYDEDGTVLPLTISYAGAVDPPQSGKPSKKPTVKVLFNDAGADGDAAAADNTFSTRFTPATQGFESHAGAIRLEMMVSVGEQNGFTYFDMYYTPDPPAIWANSIREAIESGSLNIYFKAQVKRPGRYVASARIDDANGKPFALAVFNEELPTGPAEIRFRAFGKLVRDNQPAFPLRVRDVDAFLLKEDTFPDRELMPRLIGNTYATKKYAYELFSDAEWQSEERERYLREFLNDVNIAKAKVDALAKIVNPPGK